MAPAIVAASECEEKCGEGAECYSAKQKTDCAKAVEEVPKLRDTIKKVRGQRDEAKGKVNELRNQVVDQQVTIRELDQDLAKAETGPTKNNIAIFFVTGGLAGAASMCIPNECQSTDDFVTIGASAVGSYVFGRLIAELVVPE